jgi:hypothetical protein
MTQLEKYLSTTLVLIEYLEEKRNPEHESLINKLYGNCLHLVAVKEKEEFKEHDFMLVYRLWISKLKLKKDRHQNLPVDIEKLTYLIEYVDKVHQKFLPQKISVLLECFCQCFSYHVESSLVKKLIEKFREVSRLISATFGNFVDNKELLTLKVLAFTKSMDQSAAGQSLLMLAFFFCRAIEISTDKAKSPESVHVAMDHLAEVMQLMSFEQEVVKLSHEIVKIIEEAALTSINLWPVLTLKKEGLVHKQSKTGRRYYLKTSKVDEEALARMQEEKKLNKEYKDYSEITRFDVDEIIKNKKLSSQKQNFFNSVESNLLVKWKIERQNIASQRSLTAIKRVYVEGVESNKLHDLTSAPTKQQSDEETDLKKKTDAQFFMKEHYKPSTSKVYQRPKEQTRSSSSLRVSKNGFKTTRAGFEFTGKLNSLSSFGMTQRGREKPINYGHSEFMLLDSSKVNHSDQFYIK